ncbi:MAG: molybdenum cofactor guanylyltransferase [Acidobacteriaceae bacterium]|nr:molybdenum cofactor guanylyltransferase [Acidobacteriaceae bacterium]
MYHHHVDGVAAFVLAGGKSSRMGTDKAFLKLGGVTLLGHALDLARSVAVRVCIVGDKAKFSAFGDIVEDVYIDCGPLGGIQAALAHTTAELNFILGVDLPFVDQAFIEYLFTRAHNAAAVVTVPRTGSGFQPLCAVYRKEFAGVAEKSLLAGRNKIDSLFAEVSTELISEEELLTAGFSADMFRNLNTPADWEQANITLK